MSRLRRLIPFDFMNQDLGLAKFIKKAIAKAQQSHQELLQPWIDFKRADQQQSQLLRDYGWAGPRPVCSESPKYRCKECGKSFVGEAHLATHRQRAHGILVAARRFAFSTQCQACGRDHYTRPRLIRHLQYLSKKCLSWCLKHGKALTEDESRELDIQDAACILKEKHSGIRASASRLPVLHAGRLQVPAEPEEDLQLPAMPQLLGHDRVPNWCLDFLQGWADTQGQWTVVPEQWTRFTDAMVAALDRSDHAFLDSFKGRIFDLVEEVTWRDEDDYEVVQRFWMNSTRFSNTMWWCSPLVPPILPHEQLHQWEAQYGMLPIWMTTRDHTLRDGSHSVASSRIQERLHGAEAEVAAEEFQWSSPEVAVPRVHISEACYFLVLFSGHRREDDIATYLHRLPSSGRRTIYPVCMDLCLDTTQCNLLDPGTQSVWFQQTCL